MTENLLELKNVTTEFKTDAGVFSAIKEVSFSVRKGETLCVVGESGSGKTITSLSTMQLLPSNGKVISGEIYFKNNNLLTMSRKQISKIRGKSFAMIFQDPMSALDPVFTCGSQIVEAILVHKKASKKEAYDRTIQLLNQVKIPHPERVFHSYPHELSGGMCQRIVIAMALSCDPELLIADEPTTALDVTVQAQILNLLNQIKEERNMGLVLITHDLGVVAEVADRVAVMYAGQVVEESDVNTIFHNPKHPYTRGLIKSVPKINQSTKELYSIKGAIPSINEMPVGCRFNPRCELATELCRETEPSLEQYDKKSLVRCWHVEKGGGHIG